MEDNEQQSAGENPREVLKPSGGRDELNLAEFPITLLSDRVPKGCKTLVFEIEPRDRQSGQPVSRKVTITGGDAYGLPTALDDEVLVGLVQLTKLKNDFVDPTVYFSRYELVKLLGWPDDGRSYRRIDESIKRWTGVTLYYDNAWWNKETGTWVSETFHIIERASLMDHETKRVRIARGQVELAFSSFKWNEVIFRSFQSGSLKRLDIEAYFSYSTSIAKRMYRFLDKRFWLKSHWEFDLKEFAFEHIGLSRKYDVAQIKNKLRPAIDELTQSTKERVAFLEPMSPEERYEKIGKGRWLVKFKRKAEAPLPFDMPAPEPQGLVAELVSRGVSPEVAAELVKSAAPEFVTLRIEVFDWILRQKNQKLIRENSTGYLVSSIRDRYIAVPKGFESKADSEKRQAEKEASAKVEREKARSKDRERRQEEAFREKRKRFWDALTPEEKVRFDEEALQAAPGDARDQYQKQQPEELRRLLMAGIRESFIRARLGEADQELAANS